MKKILIFLTFVISLFFLSYQLNAASIDNLSLYQVDWYDESGTCQVQYSSWGRIDIDVIADPTKIYYLDISASIDTISYDLIIENYPIFPDDIGNADYRQSIEFDITDLGIYESNELGIIDVKYSLDEDYTILPNISLGNITAKPLIYMMSHKDETWDVAQIGCPMGHKADAPVNKTDVIQHKNVSGVQEDDSTCLAGSFARSIKWLDKEYKLGTNKTAQTIYDDLRKLHVGSRSGDPVVTTYEQDVEAKAKYLKEKISKYGITKIHDSTNSIGKVNGVSENTTTDTLEWLKKELKTEDVELHYGGHIITVTGFYTQGSKHYVKFRDDEHQGNDASGDTSEKEGEIYKSGGSYYFRGKGITTSEVKVLISESIVPEPSSWLLLFFGLIGILGIKKTFRVS